MEEECLSGAATLRNLGPVGVGFAKGRLPFLFALNCGDVETGEIVGDVVERCPALGPMLLDLMALVEEHAGSLSLGEQEV